MELINAIFKRDKDKNLTSKFKAQGKGIVVTKYIEDLIEPLLMEMVVKDYFKSECEDVHIEILDVKKLPDLIKQIDAQLFSLSEKFRNSKKLKDKNEIFSELESISNLNSLIRDYYIYLQTPRKRKKDFFIYYT